MAFASWWYKTVNRSDRPWAGLGRECALPSLAAGEVTVQDFAGEGWGAGCGLLSDLQGEAPGEAETHPAVVCGSQPGRARAGRREFRLTS